MNTCCCIFQSRSSLCQLARCSLPVAPSGHQGCQISGFLSICIYGISFHPTNTNTHVHCVAHFVPFSQQHIARTLISNANSAQISLRMSCYWQKSMPPKIFEQSAELENSAILTAQCSSFFFPQVWTDYQLATITFITLNKPQLFTTTSTAQLKIDPILAFSLHLVMPFVLYSHQLLQLRTCIISRILCFSFTLAK